MSKIYKIAVIGAGDRGRTYSGMLKGFHSEDAELCAVCDILDERAQKAVEEYGFKEKFSDYKEAITKTKPDIVIVAAPAYFHCDMAAFAMENGAHVLTEKPFDLDMKKCFELRETQKKTGKVLAVGLQYRNRRAQRAMKYVFEQKLLGRNVVMSFNNISENRPKIAMHDAKFGNGGPMVDFICHALDLMRWYFGSNPKSAAAQWRINTIDLPRLASIENKAPDQAVITVEYECGSLGTLYTNWGMPTKSKGFGVQFAIGSDGMVKPDSKKNDGVIVTKADEEIVVEVKPSDESDLIKEELAVYNHFVAEIEGRGKSQASFDEGIYSLATSMAAIKSGAQGGKPVSIAEILETKPTILECMKG